VVRPLVIAHRGASGRWPEHSRPAFVQALLDGADGIECDIRLTADGVPVCWHDATVDRTSDGSGAVHEHTIDELRRLDVLRGARPPSGALWDGPPVVTLAELLALVGSVDRPVTLAIELKHPVGYGWQAEDAVLEVLHGSGWRAGDAGGPRISLMSFHPRSLVHLHRSVPAEHLMPLIDVGALEVLAQDILDGPPGEVAALVAESLALADAAAVGGVGPSLAFLREHPDRVAAWRESGVRVRVWTVDEPPDLELCLRAGVDEVTTNRPAEVLRALAAVPGPSSAP